jgi:tol-pal system protein YbgF
MFVMGSNHCKYPLRAAFHAALLSFAFSISPCAQAPIIDAGQPVSPSYGNAATPAPAAGGSAAGELYQQLQTLQDEVMHLRGLVEEQGHQLEVLRQQSLDRYNDLDKRLSPGQAGAAATAVPAPAAAAGAGAAIDAGAGIATAAPATATDTAKPDEYEAYQQAYAKIKGQDFSGGIKAFKAFLQDYPGSTLIPNAYYWLGELYLQAPQDLNSAQQSFAKVVGDYPQHAKAPDALYKLGRVYFLKGDKTKAKQLLQQVIDEYGSSGSSAPQLAKQFLDQNFHQ